MKIHMKIFLIYSISYKTFIGEKPLSVSFDEIDGFIKIYDGIRYLVIFGPDKCNAIYDRLRYIISQERGIEHSINHSFERNRIGSYNCLPTEKLTFHNVVIKSVFTKNENKYYYNII